jgi:hypothetical protein
VALARPTFVPTFNERTRRSNAPAQLREVVAMSERSAKFCARCVRHAARRAAAGALLFALSAHATAQAQTYPPVTQRYLSNGADMTTVPRPGDPGSEWFSNGADATTVPKAGQPGAEYFSSGADATSTRSSSLAEAFYSRGAEVMTPKSGTPAGEYFSRGAETTSAKPGTFAGQYFSQGAAVTSVPKPGQLGAEYFSQGADATNVSRWFDVPAPQTPAAPEQEASEAQSPNEVEGAPAAAPSSEQPGASEQGAAEAGAADSVEGQGEGEEQAATLTAGQEPPSPSDGRAIDSAASTSSPVTTSAGSTLQRARADDHVRTQAARAAGSKAATPSRWQTIRDVLGSYTLALVLVLIVVPLLALLIAFGGRAYARRHA